MAGWSFEQREKDYSTNQLDMKSTLVSDVTCHTLRLLVRVDALIMPLQHRSNLPHLFLGHFLVCTVLHLFAQSRRLIQGPRYLSSTKFFCKDLWKVDLRKVDVVAVYGLGPIMKDLGIKMQQELQPGSVILSNVFSIPGWRTSSSLSRDGMHIYIVPDCWKKM